MWINYIAYTLISVVNVYCISTFTIITSSKTDNAVFIYPGQAKSERDLGICEQHSVCNIVHHRFWFPNQVERLCKCPNREECPWKWSTNDDLSMPLDNRSQLKFCKPINELPDCTMKSDKSITIKKTREDNNVQIKAKVHCNCPRHTTWALIKHEQKDQHNETTDISYVEDLFKCKKLMDCNTGEFCGFIRTDYYSTYTKCTCPYGHLCLHKDRQESITYEMLFYGTSYRAECTPLSAELK